jgi:hypothetical protein
MRAEVEIISPVWGERFKELLDSTEDSLRIMSPFVKLGVSKLLLESIESGVSTNLLTTIKIGHFAKGVSDISAIKLLSDGNVEIKNARNLHAKVYIFDQSRFVITSSNLTQSGLFKNIEYGLLVESSKLAQSMISDYDTLFNDGDKSFTIDIDSLEEAEAILKKLPKPETISDQDLIDIEKRFYQPEPSDDLLVGGQEEILSSMTGWKKEVLEVLFEMPEIFTLAELGRYEPHFQTLHPESSTVMARARQTLQQLRDMGLIEFVDNKGTYRKLWR